MDETGSISAFDRLFNTLFRRQLRGPGLIIIGCMLLYLVATNASGEVTTLHYGLAALLGVVVIAGVVITFQELRGEAVTAEAEPLPASTSDLEHALTQLSRNYELLRRQTTQGFILASVFMLLGIIVILSGSVGELFGLTTSGSNLASIAGVITEFISATALYVYNVNFKRIGTTSDQLNHTWKVLAAFRRAETLPDQQKSEVTIRLIDALIEK